MPTKVQYWLPTGLYKEEGERRIARVLLGFIFIFILTSLFIVGIGFAQGDTSGTIPLLMGTLIILAPLFFLYRGNLSASSYLTIILFIALVTLFSTLGYGIRDYAILGYPTAIVFAGLAEKRRGLIFATFLTSMALAWLTLGEKYGLFVVRQVYTPTWFDLVLSIQGIVMLAFVVNMLVTNLVERLNQLQQELTQRKQVEEALEHSKGLIHGINNNLVSGMIYQVARYKDGMRKFTYVSDAVRKFYGVDPVEVMKNPDLIYSKIHPEDRERIFLEEEEANKTMSVFRSEVRMINPDGSLRWSSFVSNPKTAEDGVTFWNGIELDITERKRSEEIIQEANRQLSEQLDEIQKLQTELHEQILRDPLTNLYNRRYLDEALQQEARRSDRAQTPFSLIVLDIDRFKQTNDTYGHPIGDLFLVRIGNLLKQHSRGMDTACRFGGEEFLLMMPGASAEDAYHRAEEIRLKCAEIHLSHEGHDLMVTISLGIATYPVHAQSAEKILVLADKAMYRSKQNGRNRTTVWEEVEEAV